MIRFSFVTAITAFFLGVMLHILVIFQALFEYDSSFASNANIVVFILMFISALSLAKERRFNEGLIERIKEEDKAWLYVLSMAIPIYCAVMFLLSLFLNRNGSPEIINGQYVLADRGKVLEIITKAEYYKQELYSLIGFTSGEILGCCGIITELYFKIKDKAAQELSG